MRFFKRDKKKADAKVVRDRRGKYWFTLYQDKSGDPLASTIPPGYDSREEVERAIQFVADIEDIDEVEFVDRFEE